MAKKSILAFLISLVAFISSGAFAEGISTHVLDLASGVGGKNIPVVLEVKDKNGTWTKLAAGITDENGRIKSFGSNVKVNSGIYKLIFDMTKYSESKPNPFFPGVGNPNPITAISYQKEFLVKLPQSSNSPAPNRHVVKPEHGDHPASEPGFCGELSCFYPFRQNRSIQAGSISDPSAPFITHDPHFDPSPGRRSSRHACVLEIAGDLDGIQYRRNDFQISPAAGTS